MFVTSLVYLCECINPFPPFLLCVIDISRIIYWSNSSIQAHQSNSLSSTRSNIYWILSSQNNSKFHAIYTSKCNYHIKAELHGIISWNCETHHNKYEK